MKLLLFCYGDVASHKTFIHLCWKTLPRGTLSGVAVQAHKEGRAGRIMI